MEELVANFEEVSVREKSAIALCREIGRDNVKWVCDSTMLLSADSYRTLYRGISSNIDKRWIKNDEPYIFMYMLRGENNFNKKDVYKWALSREMKVVYVTANNLNDKFHKEDLTIEEWLYLIDGASYVVTNSFHGAVFSIIFKKKFMVIPYVRNHIDRNDRFESLFEFCHTMQRFYQGDFDVMDMDNDYSYAEQCVFLDEVISM